MRPPPVMAAFVNRLLCWTSERSSFVPRERPMTRLARVCLFTTLGFAVCLVAVPTSRGDDDDAADIKEAQKATEALQKLIDAVVAKQQDIPALAKALNDKTDLKHVMWSAYKPRSKGGLGVGAKAGAVKPDGIEYKLNDMTKGPLPAARLEKESPDLIRMAQAAQAMVEIAEINTPKKDDGKKKVADWKKFNKDQKDGAQELIEAVNANNPKAVQAAATKLYGSCTSCHGQFR
jgi:cytochrome c556